MSEDMPNQVTMLSALTRDAQYLLMPLTMNRPMALEYTGISRKLFADLERSGSLRGRRIGPSGSLLFQTAQLQEVVALLFGDALAENMEFAD